MKFTNLIIIFLFAITAVSAFLAGKNYSDPSANHSRLWEYILLGFLTIFFIYIVVMFTNSSIN